MRKVLVPGPIEKYRGCTIFETSILPWNANKTRCVFAVIEWGRDITQTDKIRYNTTLITERATAIKKLKKIIDAKLKILYS